MNDILKREQEELNKDFHKLCWKDKNCQGCAFASFLNASNKRVALAVLGNVKTELRKPLVLTEEDVENGWEEHYTGYNEALKEINQIITDEMSKFNS